MALASIVHSTEGTIVGLIGAAVVVLFLAYQDYKQRKLLKRGLPGLAVDDDSDTQEEYGMERGESDQALFHQHKRINELTIAKLEAETALLRAQARVRADDEDRAHATKEYHELMVSKTMLEIDSLRLHIAEQRKRIDEWGTGG